MARDYIRSVLELNPLRSRTRWIPIASRKRKSSDLYKEGVVEIVNVQPRNGKAKPYQVKQVRELLLKYKIDIERSDWGERHGR